MLFWSSLGSLVPITQGTWTGFPGQKSKACSALGRSHQEGTCKEPQTTERLPRKTHWNTLEQMAAYRQQCSQRVNNVEDVYQNSAIRKHFVLQYMEEYRPPCHTKANLRLHGEGFWRESKIHNGGCGQMVSKKKKKKCNKATN